MANLRDMRKWAAGHDVEGLPKRPNVRPAPTVGRGGRWKLGEASPGAPSVSKLTKMTKAATEKFEKKSKYGPVRYKINTEGTDAVLHFGRHRDSQLSAVAKADSSYLDWLIKEEFPDDLKDVAKHILSELSKKVSVFEDDDEGPVEYDPIDECGAVGCGNPVERKAPHGYCSAACKKNHEFSETRKPAKCKTPRCKNPSGAPGGYCSMACERDHMRNPSVEPKCKANGCDRPVRTVRADYCSRACQENEELASAFKAARDARDVPFEGAYGTKKPS